MKMLFQSQPYSMVRQTQERVTGNEAFEGFAIDLIAEIAQILSKKIKGLYKGDLPLSFYFI